MVPSLRRQGRLHCRLSAVARAASGGGGRQKWAERAPSWSVGPLLSLLSLYRCDAVHKAFRLSFSSLSCPPPHRPGGQEDRCCLPFVGQRLRWDIACVPGALRLVAEQRTWGGAGERPDRPPGVHKAPLTLTQVPLLVRDPDCTGASKGPAEPFPAFACVPAPTPASAALVVWDSLLSVWKSLLCPAHARCWGARASLPFSGATGSAVQTV